MMYISDGEGAYSYAATTFDDAKDKCEEWYLAEASNTGGFACIQIWL